MLTVQEARQRMNVNRMSMRFNSDTREYRVNFLECNREETAYYTDCIEDAVLTAGNMRKRKRDAEAARFAFGHAISCTV